MKLFFFLFQTIHSISTLSNVSISNTPSPQQVSDSFVYSAIAVAVVSFLLFSCCVVWAIRTWGTSPVEFDVKPGDLEGQEELGRRESEVPLKRQSIQKSPTQDSSPQANNQVNGNSINSPSSFRRASAISTSRIAKQTSVTSNALKTPEISKERMKSTTEESSSSTVPNSNHALDIVSKTEQPKSRFSIFGKKEPKVDQGKEEQKIDATLYTPDNADNEFYIPGFLEFTFEDFRKLSKMLTVSNVTVYEGDLFNSKNEYNGKTIIAEYARSKVELDEALYQQFQLELSLLYKFNKMSCFARLVGYCNDPPSIILKKTTEGTLYHYLANKGSLISKRIVLSVFKDIVQAVFYLHEIDVSHGHITSDSIYVEIHKEGKHTFLRGQLGNQALATNETLLYNPVLSLRRLEYDKLSIKYAAPEALERARRKFRARDIETTKTEDLYSLGILLLQVMTKKIKF